MGNASEGLKMSFSNSPALDSLAYDSDGVLTKDEIRKILTRPTGTGARTMNIKMANDVRDPPGSHALEAP